MKNTFRKLRSSTISAIGKEFDGGHNDTWNAVFLLGVFAVSLSAPELTDIRRPFHDAVGLFYGRILFTDAITNGSIPMWFTYARYSYPTFSLEGGMGWSPIGFLVGAFAPYTLFSWAFEGFVWNILCLGSAFLFARRFVRSPITAAAVAISYSASGLMIASVPTIGTTRAFQIGPLALLGLRILANCAPWTRRSWARGTLVLTATGTLWLTSGYPGIWLTAPVLLAPYTLMSIRGKLAGFLSCASGIAVAALLSLGLCSLLVDGSLNTPYFGNVGVRPMVSPGDGALFLRNLIHAVLVNPGYHRDISGPLEPLYLGSSLIPGMLMVGPHFRFFALEQFLPIRGIFTALLAVIFALYGFFENSFSLPWFILFFIILTSQYYVVRSLEYFDLVCIISILSSVILSSINPLSDVFRSYIPPFTVIRWNNWYLWTAVIFVLVYVFRNIEHYIFYHSKHISLDKTYIFKIIVAATIFCLAVSLLPGPIPIDYNIIHTLSLYYIALFYFSVLAVSILFVFIYFFYNMISLHYAWICYFLICPLLSGYIINVLFLLPDNIHRTGTNIPNYFFLLSDLAQIIIFPIIFLIFIYKYKNSLSGAQLTSIAVTILALDMSTAAPRILSHTDYLRAGQVSNPTSVDRVFSFTGNERLPNDATMSSGSSLYNAFKKYPDQLKLVGAQPQMEVYDAGAGSQSPFAQFVRFPNNWSAPAPGGLGHAELDTVADIPGQSWPPSDGGIVIAPDCIGKQPATPTGLVTKLLPDQVLLSVQTDCTRLVVLMDTWALGWTVTVDGKPAQPIRVNGVLRGVEVTTGDHVVNWFYRPVNWKFIVGVTIVSLLATIALAVASVVRHSQLKALPA